MRFIGTKTAALVFLALFSSSMGFSAGKHGKDHGKAVKECTDKGGTWDKKKKKCDAAHTDSATTTPESAAPTTTPAPTESAPAPE